MILSLDEQVAAVIREIGLRKRVYPRWVCIGKLSQTKADHEIAAMEAVLETLKRVQAENEPSLFGEDGQ